MSGCLTAKLEWLLHGRRLEPANKNLARRIVQKALVTPQRKVTGNSHDHRPQIETKGGTPMKTKPFGKLAAAFAVGWAISASAPVLAGVTISALTSPLGSFATDSDRDDAIANPFGSMVDFNLAIKVPS
jgi:hypothetical protein